ncbi:agmatinase [Halobacteriovorax sp. YZS-1-1]|uniref:agmatinase n=1 Tax=unclassified Halobacteriovorax TaxID=2639665 RepID=UPI00399B0748
MLKLKGPIAPETPYDMSIATDELRDSSVSLIGFGFDGTACFRKGTRLGPDALREVSDGIETYSPYLDLTTEDYTFYDLGNLPVKDQTEASWQEATKCFEDNFSQINFKEHDIKLMTLGGEHSISYAPIKKYLNDFDDLVLIHLDAHADLRDGYLGYHYSHASIIKRSLDHFKEGHELIQYGIRSGTKEEYEYMNSSGSIAKSRKEFLERVSKIDSNRPIYLTLDLDYFDPSFFPGTGTPEPGGEDFHSFISFVKILTEKNIVGCDVVELSPEIDLTGNSSVFAAKVVRELILLLTSKTKGAIK